MGSFIDRLRQKVPQEADTREQPCPGVIHNKVVDYERAENLRGISHMAMSEVEAGFTNERIVCKKDVTLAVGPLAVIEAVEWSLAQLEPARTPVVQANSTDGAVIPSA